MWISPNLMWYAALNNVSQYPLEILHPYPLPEFSEPLFPAPIQLTCPSYELSDRMADQQKVLHATLHFPLFFAAWPTTIWHSFAREIRATVGQPHRGQWPPYEKTQQPANNPQDVPLSNHLQKPFGTTGQVPQCHYVPLSTFPGTWLATFSPRKFHDHPVLTEL